MSSNQAPVAYNEITFKGVGISLPEHIVNGQRPDANVLVINNNATGETEKATYFDLKTIIEGVKDFKEFKSSAEELTDVFKNVRDNKGRYIEKIDDGLNPKTTITGPEELAKYPYLKSETQLLKEGVKGINSQIKELSGPVSTVYGVGKDGPKEVTPATSLLYDEWTHRSPMGGGDADIYGSWHDQAGFDIALSKGYPDLVDYVNETRSG